MYLFEMKKYFRAFLISFIIFSIVLALFLGTYSMFSSNVNELKDILAQYPKEVLLAMSLDIDLILSFTGFFAYVFLYASFVFYVFCGYLGISLFSDDAVHQVEAFTFMIPLTRLSIWRKKVIAGLCYILLYWVIEVALLSGILFFVHVDVIWTSIYLIQIGMLLLGVFLFFVGQIVSLFFRKIRYPNLIAFLFVAILMIARIIVSLFGDEQLLIFSLLDYFNFTTIVLKNAIDIKFVGIIMILSILFAAYGAKKYENIEIAG